MGVCKVLRPEQRVTFPSLLPPPLRQSSCFPGPVLGLLHTDARDRCWGQMLGSCRWVSSQVRDSREQEQKDEVGMNRMQGCGHPAACCVGERRTMRYGHSVDYSAGDTAG